MNRIVFVLMFLLLIGIVSAEDHECFDIATDGCGDIDSSGAIEVHGDTLAETYEVATTLFGRNLTLTSFARFPIMDISINKDSSYFNTNVVVNGLVTVNNILSAGSMFITNDFVANRFIGFLNFDDACDEASNRIVGGVTGVSFIFKSDNPSC